MKSTDIIKASTNSLNIYSFTAEALERLIEAVKAEQSCKTCEALARTVMLDQTSHDTTPPQRKPLTDDEIWKNDDIMTANSAYGANFETLRELIRATEAAHGITGEQP